MPHAVGTYTEIAGRHPSVAAIWTYEVQVEAPRLIPEDGCFDLILLTDIKSGRRDLITHEPLLSAHESRLAPGISATGVRLNPGFGGVLRLREIAAQVAVRAQAGDSIQQLRGLIVSAVDGAARPPAVVLEFVAMARERLGEVRLTTGVGAAERELQRACRAWLGMSPKAFLRVVRVRAAASAIRGGAPIAAVAAELAYADQSHLSREVRALLGVTPRALVGADGLVGNLQDGGAAERVGSRP
jgi:AraC-like DNA-binding protein